LVPKNRPRQGRDYDTRESEDRHCQVEPAHAPK
jgi:hypothetical protein